MGNTTSFRVNATQIPEAFFRLFKYLPTIASGFLSRETIQMWFQTGTLGLLVGVNWKLTS